MVGRQMLRIRSNGYLHLLFASKNLVRVESRYIAGFYRRGTTVNELSKLHGTPC